MPISMGEAQKFFKNISNQHINPAERKHTTFIIQEIVKSWSGCLKIMKEKHYLLGNNLKWNIPVAYSGTIAFNSSLRHWGTNNSHEKLIK